MALRLFNTLTRKVDAFTPLWDKEGVVTLYTCGPTVYNYLHIGNYRTYVFEDVLKRALKLHGFKVRHVMNITDVGHLTSQADEGDDKMTVAAKREGKTAWDVAKFYTATFLDDIKSLRIDFTAPADAKREVRREAADILSYATGHIPEQTAMVDALAAKGFTYETADGIYFDTAKFPGYYKLVGEAHIAGLQEGARVSMGEKRNPTDFALWKFSPAGEARQMEWDYRGRKGFPGWHIECSAMAKTYLGDTFDIHCGGVDHIPIHHTNEIAQAECSSGKDFVRFWLHGEFLLVKAGKMSKSDGTFITLADLKDKGFDPLDYRMYCYGAHYRKQLDFSWEALESAKTARRRLRERALEDLKAAGPEPGDSGGFQERFRDAVGDDLNMPNAMAVVHESMSRLGTPEKRLSFLRAAEAVLALGLLDAPKAESLPADLQALFERYAAAKKAKDFKSSDALRSELAAKGIKVKDTPQGSTWSRA
ncbi:MAG: cysteine--tRNA ligase [Elusimicrobia bacterium]|nr:cysteine--tRNA ligase [Elusimicrobiota bacterium]